MNGTTKAKYDAMERELIALGATKKEAGEITDLVHAGDAEWNSAADMLASYRAYWQAEIAAERAELMSWMGKVA